jgi:hypothetical protein
MQINSFKKAAIVLLLTFALFPVQAVEKSKMIPGFIFNMANILSNIESYQAGVGVKLKDLIIIDKIRLNLRGVFDADINDFFDDYALKLGLALEWPFIADYRISPYWGVCGDINFIYAYHEYDADNWTKRIDLPFSFGAILGVEVYATEFISFFAEYNISLIFTNTFDSGSGMPDKTSSEMKLQT